MREKPKLQVTRDYDRFEMHELQREIKADPLLEESMKTHGFMPSGAIHCVRGKGEKLRIIRGHHRLHYAKRLGLAVWYIVDESNTDMRALEASSHGRWSLLDFLYSRAHGGDKACQSVIDFSAKHGISKGISISLLGGETAGSGNHYDDVKGGTYRLADDLSHARAVAGIVDHCRACGIESASRSAFVQAVSKMLRVPEFEAELFKHRLSKNPSLLTLQATAEGYLAAIEDVYNYGAKVRVPLKFRAEEVGRQRKATFGGSAASRKGHRRRR